MKYSPWFGAVIGAVILGAAPSAGAAAQHEQTTGELTVSRSWWVGAKRGIEEREYHVAPVEGKDQAKRPYQAPNRKHNIRTYFGDAGITLQDRTSANNPELVSFSFKGLGRGTSFPLLGGEPPEIRTEKNRIELRRQGITEWYVNRPDGLEQGFEIPQRIPGEGELTLLLETRGAMLRVAGDKIVITSPTGRELEYGKLIIIDGDGKIVPGRLELKGTDRVVIAMDDTDARYPLSVDPLITSLFDAMLESDQADAWFGFSVAGAGDVNNDGYDDVIVGAPNYDKGQTDEGAAFVYLGGATGVATIAAAVLESNQAGSSFGWSVAGAGDVNNDGYADIIVGAYLYDNGQTNEGAAFVYHGSYNGIVTTAARILESDQAGAWFGYSVSGAGDVNDDGYADIIVGAYLYDNGQTDEGAAFVYHGSDTGVASAFAARLESNQPGAWLGTSVAGAGDVDGDGFADVIVGAQHFTNGQTNEGAALVYHGSATGVALAAAAQLESNQAGAESGISVAGAGDVNNDGYADVIVGAYLYNSGQTDEGVAFVYYGSDTGVLTTPGATLEANQAGAWFGISVAGAGDVDGDGFADVIVGASNFSDGQNYEGAAFVYHGSIGGVATTADTQLESDQVSAWFGVSVAGAGDVNNDGFADVIVGSFGFDNDQTGEGAAFIYHGTTTYTVTATAGEHGSLDTGYMSSPQMVIHGETTSFKFDADSGYRVATVDGCGISYTNGVSTVTTYEATTSAVTADCTVTATFSNTYSVTATAGANGSLDTAYMPSPQTVVHGGTTSFKFDAAAGYHVASISGCGISYTNSVATVTTHTVMTGAVTAACEVTAAFALHPPAAPVPISPSGIGNSSTPTYTFQPVAGATNYRIYLWNSTLGSGITMAWVSAATAGCSNEIANCTILQSPALADGPYSWYVMAQNAVGISPWSSSMNFSVGTLPPAPVQISPSGSIVSATPSYTFRPIAGATNYRIYLWNYTLGSGITMAWVSPTTAGCANETANCAILQSPTLANGPYAWYVLAQNVMGTGPWSSAMYFTSGPPLAPVPLSPAGGDVSATPVYTFKPIVGATSYRVYLWSRTLETGANTAWITPSAAGCANEVSNCIIGQSPALGNGPYEWYVQAQNIAGTGPWSASMFFNVGGLPVAPILIGPSGSGIGTTPSYTFKPIAEATGYRIYLWNSALGSGVTLSWVSPAAAGCADGTTDCAIPQSPALASGPYIWYVRAQNPTGTGPWSSAMSFIVGGPPAAPLQIGPVGGGTGATPSYTFKPVVGATSYRIYLLNNTLGSGTNTAWVTPLTAGCADEVSDCTIVQSPSLGNGPYAWYVRAQNYAGQGPWSPAMTFLVP